MKTIAFPDVLGRDSRNWRGRSSDRRDRSRGVCAYGWRSLGRSGTGCGSIVRRGCPVQIAVGAADCGAEARAPWAQHCLYPGAET